MTCWATVTTMMMDWRDNRTTSIPTAIGSIGDVWLAKFTANQGLSSSEKPTFLAAAGLMAEPPMGYTIEGWLQLLRTYGPLWVTTDEDPTENFAIHARIVVGIDGDGTPDGTNFSIVDPATASEYTETVSVFNQKFESEARANQPLRIQVVHWPAGAQSSTGAGSATQSYRMQLRSPARRTTRAFEDAGVATAAAPLAWGARVSPEFRDRVRNIATNIGCDPNHLMACIAFESAETFSPSVRNPTGATGLIQFTGATATNLGTSTDALAAMTDLQQLDYVERYLQPWANRLGNLGDLYMAILWPNGIGMAGNEVLFKRGSPFYSPNAALDADGNGEVTKDEAVAPVQRRLEKGLQPGYAA